MTWIVPNSLTSRFVPATEALTWGSDECFQACEQSLMRRSKSLPAASWRRAWKQGSLIVPRFGLMLKPSHSATFTARYVSSVEATHVSHFQPPENGLEQPTHAISGPSLQMGLELCDPSFASLRTSRDTSALDSEMSSESWEKSVTEQRGDYSRRLKLVRLTSESASSSWPTVTANEDSYRIGGDTQASKCLSGMARRGEMSGPAAQASPSTAGSRQESLDKSNWATPCSRDHHPNGMAIGSKTDLGNQAKSWATPRPPNGGQTTSGSANKQSKHQILLQHQVSSWATPAARDTQGPRGKAAQERKGNPQDTLPNQLGAKLNPRWVETLMGLPVGWTMPSCASPATIAPTNCGSSEMELFPPQQSGPSAR
mgnify:CR=1 FL=1